MNEDKINIFIDNEPWEPTELKPATEMDDYDIELVESGEAYVMAIDKEIWENYLKAQDAAAKAFHDLATFVRARQHIVCCPAPASRTKGEMRVTKMEDFMICEYGECRCV